MIDSGGGACLLFSRRLSICRLISVHACVQSQSANKIALVDLLLNFGADVGGQDLIVAVCVSKSPLADEAACMLINRRARSSSSGHQVIDPQWFWAPCFEAVLERRRDLSPVLLSCILDQGAVIRVMTPVNVWRMITMFGPKKYLLHVIRQAT
jgi:hypothetical protein